MASALQLGMQKAQSAALANEIGSGPASALTKGIPATTTMAFIKFFKTSGTKIKIFFTKTIPSLFQKPRTAMKTLLLSFFFLVLLGLGYLFYNFIVSRKDDEEDTSTSEGFVDATKRDHHVQNILNTLNANTIAAVPRKAQGEITKLFNIQPLTFKQAAFLGPTKHGYFNAPTSILDQLKAGCRSFFLQIDYIESDSLSTADFGKVNEPCLVYRDNHGNLTSKNSAKLVDVFRGISEYAFNDLIPNNNIPIIIYLHFVRIPFSTTDTTNYMNYMSKVSGALNILRPLLINGGYYRAAKEADLFANDFPSFGKTVILGTNIDTSVFTRMPVEASLDLDYVINFHYYQLETETVDITTIPPHNTTYNALIFNASTVLETDPKVWAKYKNYFIIVKPSNEKNLSPEEMSSLLNDYNVNVVLYDYFDNNIEKTKKVKSMYQASYTMKPVLMQV